MKITEHLYTVWLKDIGTGRENAVKVWATSEADVTHKLSSIVGTYEPYICTGIGPIYEYNKLITRHREV